MKKHGLHIVCDNLYDRGVKGGKTMEQILKRKNVFIKDKVENWVESIHVAVAPLVEQGYCEQRYIDGIIQNTNEFGPYYVLCENLALLHARSEQGVISTQVSITVLKQPIKFKEDGFDVRVLVALGATDAEAHLDILKAMSNVFADEQKVQSILDATQPEAIYDIFASSVE